MAENLFCEEPNCGNPAQVFGFVGHLKRKACQEHSLLLINKQVSLYSITAFAFMQIPEDASLYEQRRSQMERGHGALAALETACEISWEEEQKHLQERCEAIHAVVQQSYHEMWLKSQQSYEQMKKDIADLRSQLEQLQVDPNFQLSPEISDLCEESAPDHLFCVVVGDQRLPVAQTLMTNFKVLGWEIKRIKKRDWNLELGLFAVSEAAENRFDVAVRAADLARQFGVEAPDFTNEASQQSEDFTQQLRCLFSASTNNEAKEWLEIGQTASKTGDFEVGLSVLQRGKSILRGSSSWELYLQLSCTLAEIHVHMSHYEDTVEECQHILSTWTPSSHSLEFLQALYYLIYSYNKLDQHSLLLSAKEEWKEKLIVDCSSCQCIQLCSWGLASYLNRRLEEGREYIEKAMQLEHFPSFITLFSKLLLGEIYEKQGKLEESEYAYASVCELYKIHYPFSIQYVTCLLSLGILYGDSKRRQEAEEQLIKAIQLCSTKFPHSIQYASCLYNLGVIYNDMTRPLEAEEQYVKAIQVYSTHFPHSVVHTNCLFNLGGIYRDKKRPGEAEEQYIKAIQVLSTHFPHSIEYANCLSNLGVLYYDMKRHHEAVEQFVQAIQLCSSHFPNSIQYADCLSNLGRIYRNTGRIWEAEEQYMKAVPIYSIHFPHSIQYADCLFNLGNLYGNINRPRDEEEYLSKAIQVYSTHFPLSIEYAKCLFHLGILYQVTKRRSEALLQLKAARRLYERVGTQEDLDRCDELL